MPKHRDTFFVLLMHRDGAMGMPACIASEVRYMKVHEICMNVRFGGAGYHSVFHIVPFD